MKINSSNSVESVYISPSTKVVALNNEGLLCGSGISIDDWVEDNDPLTC